MSHLFSDGLRKQPEYIPRNKSLPKPKAKINPFYSLAGQLKIRNIKVPTKKESSQIPKNLNNLQISPPIIFDNQSNTQYSGFNLGANMTSYQSRTNKKLLQTNYENKFFYNTTYRDSNQNGFNGPFLRKEKTSSNVFSKGAILPSENLFFNSKVLKYFIKAKYS
jgi:hypothetical protein